MSEDRPLFDTVVEMTAASVSRCNLNARELMLVRTAALAASDASSGSYLMNLPADVESGLTLEDAQGVLIAAAPIIGTTRTLSAAMAITEALGLALEMEWENAAD